MRGDSFQGVDDALPGERHVGLQQHTLATPLIDHRQHPKGTPLFIC